MLTSSVPAIKHCQFVMDRLGDVGYRRAVDGCQAMWRVSPHPFWLSAADVQWFQALGHHIYKFYQACNDLYHDSSVGRQPPWVAQYLNQGKPAALVQYGSMQRFRHHCPTVLRPDVIPTPHGMMITELDAVPGGIGVSGRLAELYAALGYPTIGDGTSVAEAFADMIRSAAGDMAPCLAIIVSEESAFYRDEMMWLAQALTERGMNATTVKPNDLWYSQEGAFINHSYGKTRVNIVYRFFELFDMPNIPGVELLMFLHKKRRVTVVPPFKAFFEEKMWFALFHHPMLTRYWIKMLGEDTYAVLRDAFPSTWVMDPRSLPPHATIPGFMMDGTAVNSWQQLKGLGRSGRKFVIKPSGFSELAWGSRGVVVGHDASPQDWSQTIENALISFDRTPYVVQEFRSGTHYHGSFYDVTAQAVRSIECRVRLCPYYFVIGHDVKLASIMATLCPLDKKKIHGMPEAIMMPCALESEATEICS
jgi:hypothetical protein